MAKEFRRGFIDSLHAGLIALLRFNDEQGIFINFTGASRR
jgi:hypothetical protein